MSIIIGIDHGYYAIKTAHCSFPAGLTSYGEHEPYTRQGLLEFGGCFFVCGTGRQPIQRDKTANDNYYLLTLAAIAKEIRQRGLPPECSVRIAAGLPLTSFGRDKPKFKDYLLRSNQPVNFKFEGVEYSITIEEVAIFPQGYAALMTEVGLLQDEPSMLLMDLGGWTVDLMHIDNAIPAADTAHSLELGMIRCVDDIREQVRRETGLSLTDAQIENMLTGHPCTVSEAVRDIVNQQGRKYTEHLLSATMEAGFDLHAIPAVLLGGGASVVSRHLSPKDGLCKTIFLLDDKVNAIGFERALAAVSRRKSEAYGTKFCSHSPSIPEEELHQAILKAVQNLAANFTDEVAAQLDGILRQMKAGENLKAQLQKQLEKAQQEFDRLLEMSLELDESTPFLDDKLRKLSGKIKILKANIAESTDGKGEDEEATKQLTAQDLLIKEYDDILTARIIEKVIVHSRQEIEIYFIGGYTQKIDLI